MNYTLHQLKIFTTVVRLSSITKAAEELHMTQPAVSIQLKNFQNQFNLPLTEVVSKRLFITEFGNSIAEIAENVLNEADNIKYKTKDFQGLVSGKLRISSASTGKYVIPYFLSDFLNEHPGIDLELDVSNKSQVINHLKDNDVDFVLVSVPPEGLDVEEEIILDNELYLVANQQNPPKNSTLIMRESGSATRRAMEMYFKGELPEKNVRLTSNEAVKQAVIAGLGISILPKIGIRNELCNEELFIIPSKGLPIHSFWRLMWLKQKKLSPVAQSYLAYVRENKKSIVTKYFETS